MRGIDPFDTMAVMLSQTIITALAIAVVMIIVFWVTFYMVLKAAIRDAIKESDLRLWYRKEPIIKEREAPPGYRWELTREDGFKPTRQDPGRK